MASTQGGKSKIGIKTYRTTAGASEKFSTRASVKVQVHFDKGLPRSLDVWFQVLALRATCTTFLEFNRVHQNVSDHLWNRCPGGFGKNCKWIFNVLLYTLMLHIQLLQKSTWTFILFAIEKYCFDFSDVVTVPHICKRRVQLWHHTTRHSIIKLKRTFSLYLKAVFSATATVKHYSLGSNKFSYKQHFGKSLLHYWQLVWTSPSATIIFIHSLFSFFIFLILLFHKKVTNMH